MAQGSVRTPVKHHLFTRRKKSIKHELLTTDHYEFIEGVEIGQCWGCGQNTNRVDLGWGAHICSVGCRKIVDIRATADLVKMDKIYPRPLNIDPDLPEDTWWSQDDRDDTNTQFWQA